jgi:Ca2+-binding RTX toxin-like protein
VNEWITRPVALFVVSVLLVALAAGAALAAVVQCVPGAATCVGTDQADQITGTFGDDQMYAQGGNDDVSGGNGEDSLIGDGDLASLDGNDDIDGGDDEDVLQGFGGSDYLDGSYDRDTIYAQEDSTRKGTDTVKGGSGSDDIYAHDGVVDRIDCGTGIDEVTYDSGIDVVAANCEDRFPR